MRLDVFAVFEAISFGFAERVVLLPITLRVVNGSIAGGHAGQQELGKDKLVHCSEE